MDRSLVGWECGILHSCVEPQITTRQGHKLVSAKCKRVSCGLLGELQSLYPQAILQTNALHRPSGYSSGAHICFFFPRALSLWGYFHGLRSMVGVKWHFFPCPHCLSPPFAVRRLSRSQVCSVTQGQRGAAFCGSQSEKKGISHMPGVSYHPPDDFPCLGGRGAMALSLLLSFDYQLFGAGANFASMSVCIAPRTMEP